MSPIRAADPTTIYSDQGAPLSVTGTSTAATPVTTTYVASSRYQGDGKLAGRVLGADGQQVHRSFGYDADPAGRLSDMEAYRLDTATQTVTPVTDQVLRYDPEGNLLSVRDELAGQAECFRYSDGLNRLTAAFTTGQDCASPTAQHQPTVGSAPYSHLYSYDDIGNLVGATDPTARTLGYGAGPAGPHALTTSGADTFGYNANGAMTSRSVAGVGTSYGWNELHQLAATTTSGAGTTSMVYDAAGARLIRRDPDGSRTLYLDGMEIRAAGSTVTATRYYGDAAVRVGGSGPEAELWWTLADRQHSTSHTVHASSGATRTRRYLPHGRHRDSTVLPTGRGYLGKTEDPTGLDQLGARYHDPANGRFLSVDPVFDLADPQSLNPYANARNNPTSMADPTGLTPRWIADERGAPCTGDCADVAEADERGHATQQQQAREAYKTGGVSLFANQCVRYLELCGFVYHVGSGLAHTLSPVGRTLGIDQCLDLKAAGCAVQAGLFFLPIGKIGKALRVGKAAVLGDDAGRAGANLLTHTADDAGKALAARGVAEGASGLSDDLVRLANQHVTDSGTTVLGAHPGYISKARSKGASYFDVGDDWDALVARGQDPWALNQHFLDGRIAAGDTVLVSVPKGRIREGTYLAREVEHLTSNGYRWVNQWSLRPGG